MTAAQLHNTSLVSSFSGGQTGQHPELQWQYALHQKRDGSLQCGSLLLRSSQDGWMMDAGARAAAVARQLLAAKNNGAKCST